ncbi:hypothetical protein [Boseongicola aestuarii]|uniref:Pantothenate kinase n=1 Tax=Boseongicola aestuarii TaxID=1470561 RepID=A0A238J094_9RHOB|nr:hypothetical protein [Boseongicola aestuarii]SMX24139.1 Pantothenate kinase [Boseongicola aestuarii]
MTTPSDIAGAIADRAEALPKPQRRNLIAVVGPPASGKTTVASTLLRVLNARGVPTGLVAMDGFHLDNSVLDARGLRARKGAPETFDLAGFTSLLTRLAVEDEVIAPTFDRSRDASIGSSSVVTREMTTVIVEGNYLLLNEPGWRDLSKHWTLSVMLTVPVDELEQRLIQRWLQFGFSEDGARTKALDNDLPNARRVLENSLAADMTIAE